MTTQTDSKSQRSGRMTCGVCGKEVVIGVWIKLAFCPDATCINSEENYFN